MAMNPADAAQVTRLLRLRLCSHEAKQLANFYEAALGFRRISVEHLSASQVHAFVPHGGRALRISLALGAQHVELIQFVDRPGRPYPDGASSSGLIFQHFAIVVADMEAAMTRLSAVGGWSSISTHGPQHLPQSSGGVTAFKFRDPEGHPLELLAFPPDQMPEVWQAKSGEGGSPFLGIDHSAISVFDSERSIAFYQSLGLAVSHRSVNHGPEQAQLDGVHEPVVEVTAMTVNGAAPHLELLCYRQQTQRSVLDLQASDVAATCMVFGDASRVSSRSSKPLPARLLQDPDGHHLSIVELAVR
jgi:catechol 2,3-dioxygenase-like lactoylglutathione lyase family enzyme